MSKRGAMDSATEEGSSAEAWRQQVTQQLRRKKALIERLRTVAKPGSSRADILKTGVTPEEVEDLVHGQSHWLQTEGQHIRVECRSKDIAAELNVTPQRWSWVKRVIATGRTDTDRRRDAKAAAKQEQAAWLSSWETLNKQASMSLTERAEMANFRAAQKLFNPNTVRKLFVSQGIRY